LFDEPGVPPEWRAQRTINKARIPEIGRYIADNDKDYVMSSLTASIDADVEFEPIGASGHQLRMGILKVPMNARFIINDGQHRRAAIEWAVNHKMDIAKESISVVFYIDRGLKKSQQMFADLNKHAVKPTKSLSILYDHRDEFSTSIKKMVKIVPIFAGLTDLEHTSISNRQNKVFTLTSIYQATRLLLNKKAKYPEISDEELKTATAFWTELYHNMPEWQSVVKGKVTPHDLRYDYVHVHGILINAIGLVGYELLKRKDWKQKLKGIKKIDFRRTNKDWEGRAVIGGRLTKIHINILLTANYLKKKLGLPLDENQKKLEKKVRL